MGHHGGGRIWLGLRIMLDATLVTCHSEKEQAAATVKGGFGYHPLTAWLDNTGEALAAVLRPGNTGSNNAADHIVVTDLALAQIPDEHRHGSPILISADGAGGKVNPVSEWVWSPEHAHEPLVSRESFLAAQAVSGQRERTRRSAAPNRHPQTKRSYRLRSYVHCGACSRRMGGRAPHGRSYYVCCPVGAAPDGHPPGIWVPEDGLVTVCTPSSPSASSDRTARHYWPSS